MSLKHNSFNFETAQIALLAWYENARRQLPWRKNHDPYRIWISEVMLQQTTVAAVIPYYEKFLARFPNLASLATAQLEDVLELWSGLGYYSRARNLHKASQDLHGRDSFPQTHTELLEVSGFGPYTARAVSSIAFNESVGVLDGNVIRVLSRLHAFNDEWWRPAIREKYQTQVDRWVKNFSAREMNQALMELGATICAPKNPACLTCPLFDHCEARKLGLVQDLPLPKPRRKIEMWVWTIHPWMTKDKSFVFTKNDYAPFLKNQWIWPGQVNRVRSRPVGFDYSHTVTHHKIYVSVANPKIVIAPKNKENRLVLSKLELKRNIPTALILKAVPFITKDNS